VPHAHVARSPASLCLSGTLFKAQGIAGFYRGIEANVMRAMVLNGTKMACYDQIKGTVRACTTPFLSLSPLAP
jgi:hypothetical protein